MAVAEVQLVQTKQHEKITTRYWNSPMLLLCRLCKAAPASIQSRANYLAMHLPPLDATSLRLAWKPCLRLLRSSPSCLMLGLLLSSVLRFRLLLGCVAGCTTRMGTLLVKRPPAYVPTFGLNATRPYMPPARCKLVTAALCKR